MRALEPNTGNSNLAVVIRSLTEDKLQLSMQYYISFSEALRLNSGHGLFIIEVSRSHTTTRHTRWYSSGPVISSSQKHLTDNTQHSQQTNFHEPGGIRTQNLSRRATADLRPRQPGY
jgi:hypothetical protein